MGLGWAALAVAQPGGGAVASRIAARVAGVQAEGQGGSASHNFTLSVNVDEVRFPFSVSDGAGQPVMGLQLGDVSLTDDGKPPREMLQLEREPQRPMHAGIMIDTSRSAWWGGDLYAARAMGLALSRAMLAEAGNEAMVMRFDFEPSVRQSWTTDGSQLRAALGNIGGEVGSRMGGTALYDSLYIACRDQFRAKPGDKAADNVLLVFSDGMDNFSHALPPDVVEMCGRRQTEIDVLFPEGKAHFDKGQEAMRLLAEQTGGTVFYGQTPERAVMAWRSIEQRARSRYLLLYRPAKIAMDGSFHRVRLRVRTGTVAAPSGYYAGPQKM